MDAIEKRNGADRAKIEAKRGIVRNELGQILRSPAWRKERIAHLERKIEDFKARTKNALAEIKDHKKALSK